MTIRLLARLGLIVALITGAGSTAVAQAPTVEDVLKTYRENREKFRTMHVQLTKTYESLDAWRLERRLKAELLELMLSNGDKGEPFVIQADAPIDGAAVLNMFRRDAAEARRELQEDKVSVQRKEFFQDGRQYQTRRWTLVKPMPEAFPTVPLTPASLVSDYNDYLIQSWTERQTPPGRRWDGHHSADRQSPENRSTECEVETRPHGQPAFMGRKFPVEGADCPCEMFFSGSAESYRIAGTDTVDGRPCVVVEFELRRDDFPQLFRASLDMARGALPLRIQRWRGLHGGFAVRESIKNYTVVTTEVREVDPGSWYPVVMTEEDFEPEPAATQALMNLGKVADKDRAAAWAKIPAVPFRRRTWKSEVERNFPHADDFFVLKFGPEHPVVDLDARRRKAEQEAKEEEEMPPRLLVKAGQTAPPLDVSKWINSDKIALQDLRGRVVVLTFCSLKNWREHYSVFLPQLHAKFAQREVDFLTICPPEKDAEKQAEAVAKFVKELGWTCPVAIDAGDSMETAKTAAAFGLQIELGIVIIGPDGIVISNDQEFPEGMQEDEALAEEWFKNWGTAAGEKWPIPEETPMAEQKKISDRVNLFHKSKAIEEALKKTGDVVPAAGTR
jgi:hypothetical protein